MKPFSDSGSFGVYTLLGEQAEVLSSSVPLEEYVVNHGDLERLGSFIALPNLKSAESVMAAWDGRIQSARAWSPSGGPAYEIYPTREQLDALYDAGWMIVLEDVERFVPALRQCCRALERELGVAFGRVNVQAFCTRAAGHGRPHFDHSFTFNCQIAGSKVWHLAKNEASRFPLTSMFLGRDPDANFARVLSRPLPTRLDSFEAITAEPGTVVFLPPGVLHETLTESGSYALAFAIERTESIAELIVEEVRVKLQAMDSLRAPRLQSQFLRIEEEIRMASDILYLAAEEIRHRTWAPKVKRFALRPGLRIETLSSTEVQLRGERTSRIFSLDVVQVAILSWAACNGPFVLDQIGEEIPLVDAQQVQTQVRHLLHIGLLEEVI